MNPDGSEGVWPFYKILSADYQRYQQKGSDPLTKYTKKCYSITKNVERDDSLIKQRWDGFVQAIALFIHQKTDVFVLTIFTTFTDVSIYSVYVMVTTGLSSLLDAIDKAVRAAFGNIIACDERDNLINTFNAYNTLIHILSTICFSTAAVSIFNFISVYIRDVSDANYIQPIFGLLIISAEFVYCLRMPYNSIIYRIYWKYWIT